ncbi:MAG TPA: TonB C-terminal domain-containing protein [Allosphingosinicella sp.]|jgi:hypothetical protein
MDRAEAAGLGVATLGHAALLAALTYGFAASRLPVPKSDPIEVSFVDEVGLESRSPTPSAAEPAPLPGPPDAAPQPAMPAPPRLPEVPAARPEPRLPPPGLAPAAKARPSPAPPKAPAIPARPASRRDAGGLSSVVAGLSDRANPSQSATPPAAAAGAAAQASLRAEVRRQLKPHWKAPTGADAEQLRTELSISLARDGRVTRVEVIRTTGQTASNRPQVKLHQERAMRAVQLASPFNLPAEYYEAWKELSPIGFDKRLSQ